MKHYRVRLSEEAEQDLIDIYRYIALHDCVENADYVLDQLESICSRLTDMPERGHIPPEVSRIGITSHREVNFKPYRVIYEVIQQNVSTRPINFCITRSNIRIINTYSIISIR